GAGGEGPGAPRVLRRRLVLEKSVVNGAHARNEGVQREQQEGVGRKVDGASGEKQPQRGSLDRRGLQRGDRGGAAAGQGVLPCRPQRGGRARRRLRRRLETGLCLQFLETRAQARTVRQVQVPLEAPSETWVRTSTRNRPFEEVARRASFAANVQRVGHQGILALSGRQRA